MSAALVIQKDAGLSACRTWRWWLSRTWTTTVSAIDGGPAFGLKTASNPLVCIGLNPSTADEKEDDPTIRRVIGFAQAWGHDGLLMLNLFAYRATDPRDLFAAQRRCDVVGERNDEAIRANARGRRVLCAWGATGRLMNRDLQVMRILKDVEAETVCLGTNKNRTPKHPLYLSASTKPIPFSMAGA